MENFSPFFIPLFKAHPEVEKVYVCDLIREKAKDRPFIADRNLKNGHNGTHHYLIDDFCKAVATGKLSPTNIWEVAKYNIMIGK